MRAVRRRPQDWPPGEQDELGTCTASVCMSAHSHAWRWRDGVGRAWSPRLRQVSRGLRVVCGFFDADTLGCNSTQGTTRRVAGANSVTPLTRGVHADKSMRRVLYTSVYTVHRPNIAVHVSR